MATFEKQKQSMRKSKKNSKKQNRLARNRKTIQRGGVSNSCTLDASTTGSTLRYNSGANLHNVNPQANLDNMNWGGYGSPVPLGSSIVGGGNKCGDDGVGTSNPKSETFKQYLDNMSHKLDLTIGGSPTKKQKQPQKQKQKQKQKQYGGGYTTDPSEFIGGRPVYKAYDDCCPPAIIGGNLMFGAPDQPVCGFGAVRGGGTRKLMNKITHNKQHSKKQLGKKQSRKQMKKQSKYQHGGDFNSVGRSKPASYGDAFNGAPGVFAYPDDMSKRTFDETQPNYSVNAI